MCIAVCSCSSATLCTSALDLWIINPARSAISQLLIALCKHLHAIRIAAVQTQNITITFYAFPGALTWLHSLNNSRNTPSSFSSTDDQQCRHVNDFILSRSFIMCRWCWLSLRVLMSLRQPVCVYEVIKMCGSGNVDGKAFDQGPFNSV